jgi:hypothetical protein
MADNVSISAGTGTTVAADDIGGGVLAQRVKVVLGPDGTGIDAVGGSGVNGTGVMRVTMATDQGAITTQLPAALGSAAAASSLGVTASTEDIARAGIITETAPATDTASSGQNGRLQRIAQRLTSLIALTPTLGTTTDSASSPVAFSTEGKAQLGSLTETAPASDTASSGINGRLQRVAQNLTTLNTSINSTSTQLPAALGPTTKSASLSITGATDDPAALGIGGTADAAATPGSTGSISAKLRTLTGQLPSSSGGSVQVTITRPANVTAYTANDVLGGALTFATGLTSGQRAMIAGVDLQPQIAAIPAGMTNFRLYLYNVTPPSAVADNGAWDLPSGDRASFLGYVDIGTPVDLGSTLFVQTDNVNKAIQLSGSANVFGYLVTNGGFTPAANSEVYLIRLQLLGL